MARKYWDAKEAAAKSLLLYIFQESRGVIEFLAPPVRITLSFGHKAELQMDARDLKERFRVEKREDLIANA